MLIHHNKQTSIGCWFVYSKKNEVNNSLVKVAYVIFYEFVSFSPCSAEGAKNGKDGY